MDRLIKKLKNKEKLSIKEIKEIFYVRDSWKEDLYYPLAKKALDIGENFYAYDIAEHISESTPEMKMNKIHIMALALARSGSLKQASKLLENIPSRANSEIGGLKARIVKDMAMYSPNESQKIKMFDEASKISLQLFNSNEQYYNGINAASCALMAGNKDTAQKLVTQKILPLCIKESNQDIWWHATMGECYLILEKYNMAELHYKEAAKIAIEEGQQGNLASVLKQFNMLAPNFDKNEIDKIIQNLQLPSVTIFSGYMADNIKTKIKYFPSSAEEKVRSKIAAVIKKFNIRISYSSCLCGSDIIFLEEMLKAGGECYVLPPLSMQATIKKYVDIVPDSNWKRRLVQILKNENVILFDSECDELPGRENEEDNVVVADFNNKFLFGSAIQKATSLHFPLYSFAVWNKNLASDNSRTDLAIKLWKTKKLPTIIITPEIK